MTIENLFDEFWFREPDAVRDGARDDALDTFDDDATAFGKNIPKRFLDAFMFYPNAMRTFCAGSLEEDVEEPLFLGRSDDDSTDDLGDSFEDRSPEIVVHLGREVDNHRRMTGEVTTPNQAARGAIWHQ